MEENPIQSRISVSQRLRQRDIALAANVSISTVSRVLNNVDGISQNIRERCFKSCCKILVIQGREEKLKSVHLFANSSLAR